ncbi:hypothetical protein EV126DRAFT_444998 [Verticillium dahliae]|nr:hypothetical protein EV126DRAFT_444998 [Verticillium dahliae]
MNDDGSLSHDSLGPRALAIVTPFFVLAILIFSVRIYTRVTPTHKLDASDYTISIAILFEVVIYSLFAITVASGFGRHSYDVTPEQGVKILRYVYMVVLLTPFVPTLTRISVGCLLLKFARTTTWRAFIWFTICIQAACAIGTEVFQFLQCRPINAHWEEVPGARCFSAEQIWICGYVIVAESINRGTLSSHLLDGAWSRCNHCRLPRFNTDVLLDSNGRGYSDNSFFRAATQVPN